MEWSIIPLHLPACLPACLPAACLPACLPACLVHRVSVSPRVGPGFFLNALILQFAPWCFARRQSSNPGSVVLLPNRLRWWLHYASPQTQSTSTLRHGTVLQRQHWVRTCTKIDGILSTRCIAPQDTEASCTQNSFCDEISYRIMQILGRDSGRYRIKTTARFLFPRIAPEPFRDHREHSQNQARRLRHATHSPSKHHRWHKKSARHQ